MAPMPLDPEIERAMRARTGDALFHKLLGIRLGALEDGESEISLDLEPHHLNPGGIVHGGVIASMLDMASGLAHRTKLGPGGTHVTTQLTVQYLASATDGTLVARGRVLQHGGRVGFAEAELRRDDGRLVAKASATFLVVAPDSLPGGR